MRRLCFLALQALVAILAISPSTAASTNRGPQTRIVASSSIQFFSTEAAAQRHCPSDEVVWLNTKTGVYHEKGMRWYGRTKSGAYVCRKEADAAGYRDTRNGQ